MTEEKLNNHNENVENQKKEVVKKGTRRPYQRRTTTKQGDNYKKIGEEKTNTTENQDSEKKARTRRTKTQRTSNEKITKPTRAKRATRSVSSNSKDVQDNQGETIFKKQS